MDRCVRPANGMAAQRCHPVRANAVKRRTGGQPPLCRSAKFGAAAATTSTAAAATTAAATTSTAANTAADSVAEDVVVSADPFPLPGPAIHGSAIEGLAAACGTAACASAGAEALHVVVRAADCTATAVAAATTGCNLGHVSSWSSVFELRRFLDGSARSGLQGQPCNRRAGRPSAVSTEYDAALLLIAKLKAFTSTELDADERGLFARLLAPGIAQAYSDQAYPDGDTTGFAMTEPVVEPLPPALAAALRDSGVRVVDFEDFEG